MRGRVASGDVDGALAGSAVTASGTFETTFVEHAYIEPEAGTARVVDGRVEVWSTTQTPYMDRDELALILGMPAERIRVIPSACGGGFGGKLDLSIQPLLAIAALVTGRPVRGVYSRPESMAATTKRHPASITATFGADADGRLTGVRFHGDFDTGAYASWGPTVANRVPVHATGPYAVAAALCTTRAVHTNGPPAGAFRGFGVPRRRSRTRRWSTTSRSRSGSTGSRSGARNALRAGSTTATGQRLEASAGLPACLDALRPRWASLLEEAAAANAHAEATGSPIRRGVGIGAMWYGIGNTSLPNPSTVDMGIAPDGTVRLFSGAMDIGQGSATGRRADRGGRARRPRLRALAEPARHRPHPGRRQDVRVAPDVRLRECRAARRRGPPAADPRAGGGARERGHRGPGARAGRRQAPCP